MTNELHEFEKRAAQATELPAFNKINFSGVREGANHILGTIGKNGFFEEYTDHSFEHARSMISMLEWLLPPATQDLLTPADWLTLVLSIYLHDLGMVVTRDEFAARSQTDFADFCKTVLFHGEDGHDYQEKAKELGVIESEKFFYQEFVRQNHAERVRKWIIGDRSIELGVATALVDEVQNLLGTLDEVYREDLAMLCASHHADDISGISTSKPYGDSEEETVNLHFLAVILRVVDLLQVTKSRTPGVLYRVINPRDPVSQLEWKKQSAVRRLRPTPVDSTDAEGDELQDTIEIHATFNSPTGYFGLTSYVEYARKELRMCHSWIQGALSRYPRKVQFPWRRIDDANIDAKGFLKDTFKFELDNSKILDLLTGHTLYNDSSVVVRELAQNAIDAVRIEFGNEAFSAGHVQLSWNSAERTLTVTDNGTGMTQSEIENNLLKVGSSRYQDPEFKKLHPDFSPISRFGIGILSTFMVADEVTIVTVSRNESQARRLTLKSVHGSYLIELLDKVPGNIPTDITSHGTEITLKFRPSAKLEPIAGVAMRFLYFPKCRVTCRIDGSDPIEIGFSNTESALEQVRNTIELINSRSYYSSKTQYRVVSKVVDGFDISFLVQKWPYSDTWNLYYGDGGRSVNGGEFASLSGGICIEGIFVREGIPGFPADQPFCIVNAKGVNAPFANVARNDFEFNDRYLSMIEAVYSAFSAHVADEFEMLRSERDRSLTYASNTATNMMSGILGGAFKTDQERRRAAKSLFALKVLAVESGGVRKTISFEEAGALSEIRHVECPFFSAAEAAITELASHSSMSDVVKALGATEMQLDMDATYLVGGLQSSAHRMVLSGWQISKLIFDAGKKRVDAVWTRIGNGECWIAESEKDLKEYATERRDVERNIQSFGLQVFARRNVLVATEQLQIDSANGEEFGIAVVGDNTLILPSSGLNEALIGMFSAIRAERRTGLATYLFGLICILDNIASFRYMGEDTRTARHESVLGQIFAGDKDERKKAVSYVLGLDEMQSPDGAISIDEFVDAIDERKLEVFFAQRHRGISYVGRRW